MRISTVIPAYNRADLIGATLESLLGQTRPPEEVIVVDDGSTDGTPEAVERFGNAVTLLRQTNAGAGAARNAGFARSTGDLVHFMDSDDLSSPNTYAIQAAALEAGADMVYGPWLKTRFAGKRLKPERLVHQAKPLPASARIEEIVLTSDWVTVFQPCLFRRSLIEAAGPYRTDLKPSEDIEMLYRLVHTARRIVHTPETIVLYRLHPENQISIQRPDNRIIDQANLWLALQAHVDARPDVSAALRRRMRMRRVQAAHGVRTLRPDLADALSRDVSAFDRVSRPLRIVLRRVQSRMRTMTTGVPVTPYLGMGPISDTHRSQIRLLGYSIDDGSLAEGERQRTNDGIGMNA